MKTVPHALLFAIEHACDMVLDDNRDSGKRTLVDRIYSDWNTGTAPTLAQAREDAFRSSWNADNRLPALSPEQVAIAGKILGLYCDFADDEHDTGEDCSEAVANSFADPATVCRMLNIEYPGLPRPDEDSDESSYEGENEEPYDDDYHDAHTNYDEEYNNDRY